MHARVLTRILLCGSTLLIGARVPSLGAEDVGESAAQAITTADPSIPSGELDLLVNPLTKGELLIEAEAWQAIVQAKAMEIAHALVAVKRQNQEIEKAREAQAHAKAAKEQLEEVREDVEEAKATGDRDAVQEAAAAAAQAQEAMEAVSDTVEDAVEAQQKTAEFDGEQAQVGKTDLAEAAAAADQAQAAISDVQTVVGRSEGKESEEIRAIAADAEQATDRASAATASAEDKVSRILADAEEAVIQTQAMVQAEAAMEQVTDVKAKAKADLLEQITHLREERVLLLDNLRTVVDELEAKTPKDDSATLATIQDYRLYMRGVSGITLDVTDTTAALVAISGWIRSPEGGIRWAVNIAKFVGILILSWFAARLCRRLLRRVGKRVDWPKLLNDFLVRVVGIAVWTAGIIWALSTLEISMAPLLAMVGAAGFIVAFAMQDSLSNFASGLMILMFRPFDVGDVVDAGGVSGKVETMNLVSTTIKTFDNKRMIIPNNKIWGDVITNSSSVRERRVDMEFGIGYDDDIEKAMAILNEIVTDHPRVLKNPSPTIQLSTLADSSVNFICRPWAKTADYWSVYWDVTKTVKLRFDAEGIGIPFPQRDVHLYLRQGEAPMPLASLVATSPATVEAPTSPEDRPNEEK